MKGERGNQPVHPDEHVPTISVGKKEAEPLMARLMTEPSMMATMTSNAVALLRNRLLPSRTIASVKA